MSDELTRGDGAEIEQWLAYGQLWSLLCLGNCLFNIIENVPCARMPGLLRHDDAFLGFFKTPEVSNNTTKIEACAGVREIQSKSLLVSRKLPALSSLFDYLCERNAVLRNPVDCVKRPASNNNGGSTPALGGAQARHLLEAPAPDTLKGVRDRAILATLLYHSIRREEVWGTRMFIPLASTTGARQGQRIVRRSM
jgi:hypothetical protein